MKNRCQHLMFLLFYRQILILISLYIFQLQQGASVLYAITSNVVGDKLLSKTLDMEGRTQAVQLLQNMAQGFNNVNVPDPNKLKPFIESVTGSVMAILEA